MNYLITGAGSGIGKAIAIILTKQGHTCFLMGRNKVRLQETLLQLNKGNHQLLIADVASAETLQTVLKGSNNLIIDGIIANAGIGGENYFGVNDRWQEIIDTNLTGTYNTVQYFLPALRQSKNKYRQIIITSSVLARLGVANYSAYCASKAGLLGLMRSWAVQFAPENILVNAICPGWVNTDMAQDDCRFGGLFITANFYYRPNY
jgi:NAD(P)-dependent dehydrogenase (short-subunit alcohol dehydrogenase family)